EVHPHVHGTRTESHGDPSGLAKRSAEEPYARMRARTGLREPWRATARATRPEARNCPTRRARAPTTRTIWSLNDELSSRSLFVEWDRWNQATSIPHGRSAGVKERWHRPRRRRPRCRVVPHAGAPAAGTGPPPGASAPWAVSPMGSPCPGCPEARSPRVAGRAPPRRRTREGLDVALIVRSIRACYQRNPGSPRCSSGHDDRRTRP